MAIDGDTTVVGAYGDDDGGTDSGAAYIFSSDSSWWITFRRMRRRGRSPPDRPYRVEYTLPDK